MTAGSSTDIRVILVSDRELFRAGLSLLIENQDGMTMVGEAGAADDALAAFVREGPDITILDMGLGKNEALELLNGIRSANNGARVILLASETDAEVCRNAIRAGAKGVIPASAGPEYLFKAITKVHAGEAWIDRSVIADVIDHISNHGNNTPNPRQATPIESLTQRELEVLRLVCEGLRNRQIADRLLISESTVRHHLTSIFNKLNLTDRFQLVLHAFRQGIVQPVFFAVVWLAFAQQMLDSASLL
jgi:DNA-binding NarL/FixJ family response regulator